MRSDITGVVNYRKLSTALFSCHRLYLEVTSSRVLTFKGEQNYTINFLKNHFPFEILPCFVLKGIYIMLNLDKMSFSKVSNQIVINVLKDSDYIKFDCIEINIFYCKKNFNKRFRSSLYSLLVFL